MSRDERLGRSAEVRLPQGTLRYRETGPADAPVLVFVHGFLVNGDLWRGVVPELADAYRCVVPDLPFGAHEVPLEPEADLTLPGLARLLADFLDALDLRGVTLVGNDTGGAVVQMAAARHAERVARIVLTPCDAFDNFPPRALAYLPYVSRVPGAVWSAAQLLRFRTVQRLPIAFGKAVQRPIDPAVIEEYLRPGRRDPLIRADVRKVLAGMRREHTLQAAYELQKFTGPALIVWDGDDPLFPEQHAWLLATVLRRGRVLFLDGSYGLIPEDQPQELAAAIRDFLAETAYERSGARDAHGASDVRGVSEARGAREAHRAREVVAGA